MTDEEKAEEYVKNIISIAPKMYDGHKKIIMKESYLDGLAEGKPKWHDLRENPNDLPKESGEFWTKWEDGAYSTVHYFADSGFGNYVIAWCELPKFEE